MKKYDIFIPVRKVSSITERSLRGILHPFCVKQFQRPFQCIVSYGIPGSEGTCLIEHDNARSVANHLSWPYSDNYHCAINPACKISDNKKGGTLVSLENSTRRWMDKTYISEYVAGTPEYWQTLIEDWRVAQRPTPHGSTTEQPATLECVPK